MVHFFGGGGVCVVRSAEYSIRGYLYQFLRYLRDILEAGDATSITIEGAIEDIDIRTCDVTIAVQCKYHEQAEKYTLGKIYKPVLLMLEHFSNNTSQEPEVRYHLFCHFPGMTGAKKLSRSELDTVLSTTSTDLKKIIGRISAAADIDVFLSRFEIEFGPAVDDLQRTVLTMFESRGFSAEDVEAVIYPAAFQRVVDIATQGTVGERTVEPLVFIQWLRNVRNVTFTRWTRELLTRGKIFQRLRKDLKESLAQNHRRRFFVINPAQIANFDDEIVKFVRRFVERYSFKYLHDHPPLFAFVGDYDVGALQVRLHDIGLRCATGIIGNGELRLSELIRTPMIQRQPKVNMEFRLRLVKRASLGDITTAYRPDDLFLVNVMDDSWAHPDINVHNFEIERLSDLEYVLQLRSDYG
jgi:hypothetical protein